MFIIIKMRRCHTGKSAGRVKKQNMQNFNLYRKIENRYTKFSLSIIQNYAHMLFLEREIEIYKCIYKITQSIIAFTF